MKIVVLTGSIGMGKSTVAKMFHQEGCALFDADACVHALYAKGGAAVKPIASLFPHVITKNAVNRAQLSTHLRTHPQDFPKLEALVHPLLAQERLLHIEHARKSGVEILILEEPLFFEMRAKNTKVNPKETKLWYDNIDKIIIVSAPPATQKARVLARPSMNATKFSLLTSRQMPDCEKKKQADYLIMTNTTQEETRQSVKAIIHTLKIK